jgi:hypothetical protein
MEIRWLGEVCIALPSSRGHSCDHQAMPLKRSREGVPAFCTMPIIHSVQYIFAIFGRYE